MRKLEYRLKTHDTAHRKVLTLEIEPTTLLLHNYGTEALAHLFIFSSFPQVPLLLADLVIMPLRPNEKSWYKLLAFRACGGSRPETMIYIFFMLILLFICHCYLMTSCLSAGSGIANNPLQTLVDIHLFFVSNHFTYSPCWGCGECFFLD